MFKAVENENDINIVIKLAHIIWNEHYPAIIGIDQVNYMLGHFHTKKAIENQISDENYFYFLIRDNNQNCGYIGFQIKENALFLSKLYILSSKRGCGYGWQSVEFLKQLAIDHNLSEIILTVNKYNTKAISAYENYGFTKTDEMCVDIGGGYFMDDYELRLTIYIE